MSCCVVFLFFALFLFCLSLSCILQCHLLPAARNYPFLIASSVFSSVYRKRKVPKIYCKSKDYACIRLQGGLQISLSVQMSGDNQTVIRNQNRKNQACCVNISLNLHHHSDILQRPFSFRRH